MGSPDSVSGQDIAAKGDSILIYMYIQAACMAPDTVGHEPKQMGTGYLN